MPATHPDDYVTYPPAYADLTLGQPNIRHEYENTTYDITLAMATERDTNAWMKKAGQVDEAVAASMMNTLDSDLRDQVKDTIASLESDYDRKIGKIFSE